MREREKEKGEEESIFSMIRCFVVVAVLSHSPFCRVAVLSCRRFVHSPFCRVAVLSIRHFVIRRFLPTPTMPQGVPSLQDNLSIQNIFNEIIFIADIEIYSKSDFLLF